MLQRTTFMALVILVLSASFSIAHPFQKWEQIQDFYKSGFTKCSVYWFSKETLNNVLILDTLSNYVYEYSLSYALEETDGPMFNDKYFVHYKSTYFFNKARQIDSILHESFFPLTDEGNESDGIIRADSTKTIFIYDTIVLTQLVRQDLYYIKNGKSVKTGWNEFAYNELNQCIVMQQYRNSSKTKFEYKYDELGRLIQEKIIDVFIHYEYLDNSTIYRRTSSSKTTYLLSLNGLLSVKITDGYKKSKLIYEYE
jgi:hypothetical protein